MTDKACIGCGWVSGQHFRYCPLEGNERENTPKPGQTWKKNGSYRLLIRILELDRKDVYSNIVFYHDEQLNISAKCGLNTFMTIFEPYVQNGLDVVLDLLDSI